MGNLASRIEKLEAKLPTEQRPWMRILALRGCSVSRTWHPIQYTDVPTAIGFYVRARLD